MAPNDERGKRAATPEGWNLPSPERVPRPTYWPAVMALAIVFLLWGIAATFLISGVGVLLFVVALAGWIGELRYEQRSNRPTHT